MIERERERERESEREREREREREEGKAVSQEIKLIEVEFLSYSV